MDWISNIFRIVVLNYFKNNLKLKPITIQKKTCVANFYYMATTKKTLMNGFKDFELQDMFP